MGSILIPQQSPNQSFSLGGLQAQSSIHRHSFSSGFEALWYTLNTQLSVAMRGLLPPNTPAPSHSLSPNNSSELLRTGSGWVWYLLALQHEVTRACQLLCSQLNGTSSSHVRGRGAPCAGLCLYWDFLCSFSVNPHDHLRREGLLLPPYRWTNWGLERSRQLSKVI